MGESSPQPDPDTAGAPDAPAAEDIAIEAAAADAVATEASATEASASEDDAVASETGARDGASEGVATDAAVTDAAVPDAAATDAAVTDAAVTDASVTDASAMETAAAGTAAAAPADPDASAGGGAETIAAADSAVPESVVPESAVPESAAPEVESAEGPEIEPALEPKAEAAAVPQVDRALESDPETVMIEAEPELEPRSAEESQPEAAQQIAAADAELDEKPEASIELEPERSDEVGPSEAADPDTDPEPAASATLVPPVEPVTAPTAKQAAPEQAAPKQAEPEQAAPKQAAAKQNAPRAPRQPRAPRAPKASRPTATGLTPQPRAAAAALQSPSSGTDTVLSVRGLTKRFGDTVAVDAINLEVRAGEFYGIVGPNGAGKTTTLSMVTGLLRPDAGTVIVHGADVWKDPAKAKRAMGVLPDRLRLFDRLTGAQFLYYAGVLRGLDGEVVRTRIADLARAFGLEEALPRLVSDYSAGMTKKVALAAAMIHSPRLLVLDEPFESVDPVSAATVTGILTRYVAAGGTVVLSSHSMDLVQRICDHVAVVVDGELLADGTMEEVRDGGTLEERFVELAGARTSAEGLEWLHSFSD